VFMCFVWISEQTAIISLYSINWLVFITETECVYCAVRTDTLFTALQITGLNSSPFDVVLISVVPFQLPSHNSQQSSHLLTSNTSCHSLTQPQCNWCIPGAMKLWTASGTEPSSAEITGASAETSKPDINRRKRGINSVPLLMVMIAIHPH
jgi:hypothetical protein